ncbi:TPA: hypothetical protein HA259_04575 [Thermoplasmata archaeon]|nr:hypothetical protein [Thermoplasmata archaeon]
MPTPTDERKRAFHPPGVLILLVLGIALVFLGIQWIASGLTGYSEQRGIEDHIEEQLEELGLSEYPEPRTSSSFFLAVTAIGVVMLILGLALITVSMAWRRNYNSGRKVKTARGSRRHEERLCRHCGNDDLEDAEFCPECGTKSSRT